MDKKEESKKKSQLEKIQKNQMIEDRYLYLPQHLAQRWIQLKELLNNYLMIKPTLDQFKEMLTKILIINHYKQSTKEIDFSPFDEYYKSLKDEQYKFIKDQMHFIIQKALLIEDHFDTNKLRILSKQSHDQLEITDEKALILICNQFLCLIPKHEDQPDIKKHKLEMPYDYCFDKIFTLVEKDKKKEEKQQKIKVTKIRFIMNYIEQEMQKDMSRVVKNPQDKKDKEEIKESKRIESDYNEKLVIERLVIPIDTYQQNLSEQFWSKNEDLMRTENIEIDNEHGIEDHKDCVLANFANSRIGGGCVRGGASQEEILFMIFPQLLVSLMVCEEMDKNEAILFLNYKRYSNYSGYGSSLKFSSSNEDSERRDIISVDAQNYYRKFNKQFERDNLLRDMNKAYVAFSLSENAKKKTISTGQWGCGAFFGDKETKFLQQWMVAVALNRKITFNTFRNKRMNEICKESIEKYRGKTVGEVFQQLLKRSKQGKK